MSTKLEPASSRIQTAASSATSLSGPKISMFANKTGFMIPKNKLAGSLVPVFRVGKKGASDSVNDDNTKQVQRKTKWGPDLSQDTTVRKARALAYQSRVDQITQLLSSRSLEGEGSKDSYSASPAKDQESSDHQLNDESVRSLELERREAIGEILKLNPSYKPPPGYKPVPKEAKIPVPIKEHPGYNFIGLIFGPAHKQLEKETGAQVKVYGTKADTGEKVEVASGENVSGNYEEMYVQVSAETYEKVDAAVALIELLVTPVSVTPAATTTKASGDGETISVEATAGPMTPPVANQGMAQPDVGTQPAQLQGHFQPFQGQWFPGPTSQNPVPPFPGHAISGISSASLVSNLHQVSPPPNLSNTPSPFGPPQGMQDGFGSVPRNPFVHSSPQAPLMRQPYMPSTHFGQIGGLGHPIPALGSTPPQSNLTPPQFSQAQPSQTGFPQVVRPVMSSLPQSVPPTAYTDRPLTPAGNSPGWSQSPWNNQTGQGPSNMIGNAPPKVSPQGSHHLASRPMGVSPAPHMDVFRGQNLAPQLSGPGPSAHMAPPLGPSSGSVPAHFFNHSVSSGQPVVLSLSPNPVPGSSLNSNSTRPTSFVTPKPLQPTRDFTFQPHHPQNSASSSASRLISQFGSQDPSPSNQMMRPHLRPAIDNPNPPPVIQGFQRPQLSNQISQPGPPMPLDFARGPAGPLPQFRHPTFSNQGIASPTGPQMQPMNFRPALNHVGSFPPRVNSMPLQQNNPTGMLRPQNFEAPNCVFFRHGRPASSSSGAHQIYDPFSPTSVPRHPHPGGNPAMAEKQESDPEYEDLMASVGVK
ncbi:leucine-rich repeat extensin-like protein 5 [Capsicum galapagoense]